MPSAAKLSATMDFDDYDRADEDQLNRILWAVAKGPECPIRPSCGDVVGP